MLKPKIIAALAVAALATPALAHHSFAMFDTDKMFIWEGTVEKFEWSNPHVHLNVVVPDNAKDPRTVGHWDLEGASPSIMGRQGWSRLTYKRGDKVVAVGQPLRDGTKGGSIWYVVKNGKRLYEDVNRNGGPGANGHGIPPGVVLP